jgi:5-methylcytosine-specific restriction endonuclease McrA
MANKKIPRAQMSEAELERARARDRDYNANNRSKKRAYNQQYYAARREEACKKSIEHYHANKPQIVAKRREQRATPEAKAAQHARNVAYRAANHARLLARERAYAKSPRGQAARKAGHRRRKARIANAPINDFTEEQWEALCKAARYRCCYCGTKGTVDTLTPDHLTPYVKQGSNTLHNVLPCCLDCNMRKKDRPVLKPVQPFLLLSDEAAAD